MWVTVNVVGWGEQVSTPPPSIYRPRATASPLADLEVGGSSFLGWEGEISVHLPSYYTHCTLPTLSCPLSSRAGSPKAISSTQRVPGSVLGMEGRQTAQLVKGLNPKSAGKVHDSQEAAGGVCSK